MASSDDIYTPRPDTDKEVRAYQSVGNSLLDRIRTGEFRAIGKLPTERELAEVYGVGRAVIRDALVMLEVKGLVQSRQGSGIYITRKAYEIEPAAAAAAGKATQPWDNLPSSGPFELVSARQWLESHMARLAAVNATDDDVANIEQAYEDHRNATVPETREHLDMLFHMAIARATQNSELVVVIGQLWLRRESNPLWQRASFRLHDSQYILRLSEDYGRLVEAFRHRDGDAAYVAMWQQIENIKRLLATSEGFEKADGRAKPAPRRRLKQAS
jgi:GntR family uxuAB operon transcriptional repressor